MKKTKCCHMATEQWEMEKHFMDGNKIQSQVAGQAVSDAKHTPNTNNPHKLVMLTNECVRFHTQPSQATACILFSYASQHVYPASF